MQRVKDDSGAVAVLVAIAMVALLGMATIVVDVGQVYAERRQLQNSADAAVLSLVQDCPVAGCDTNTSTGGRAGTKANQNTADGAATVSQICGNATSLSPCSPASGLGDWDCRPVPGSLASADYVQVRTETRANSGGSLLPPFLARVLNPGYAGTTVRACARASWGGPAALTAGLSLTISSCEWDLATAGGTSFPVYPPAPPTSAERVLELHTTGGTVCPTAGHAGSDEAGAFGWLDDTNGNCTTEVSTTTGEYSTSTGVSISQNCQDALDVALTAPYPVLEIPVYQSVVGSGGNSTYTLRGFTAFVVTGARLPGYNRNSWLYPSNPQRCGGPRKCVYGFFTKSLVPVSGTVGGPSMGVTVIQLSG